MVTDSTAPKKSFVQALKEYFNLEGGTLMKEYKALTAEDKKWFHAELNKAGIACDAPSEKKD
jgi:ABC-type branched-subunit amino acid transport system substrate-binding protein